MPARETLSPAYGRSPALDAVAQMKAEQALDRADLEDGSEAAIQRLLARKRPLWAALLERQEC